MATAALACSLFSTLNRLSVLFVIFLGALLNFLLSCTPAFSYHN